MRAVQARMGSRSPEVMKRPSFAVRRVAYGALTTLPTRITRELPIDRGLGARRRNISHAWTAGAHE